MYPGQASFFPVQAALARFLEAQGWQAVNAQYPFWYLGKTPWRYLTGPILPSLLVGLKHLTGWNWFVSLQVLNCLAFVGGAIGFYYLVRFLSKKPGWAGWTALVYAFAWFLPAFWPLADGLYLISFSWLFFVWWAYAWFLKDLNWKRGLLLCLLISFAILLNTLIIPSLLLGLVGIFWAVKGWKKAEPSLKQTLCWVFLAFLLASLWYTPSYWWQILAAPSLAGKPLVKVLPQLAQLLPLVLALVIALISTKIMKLKDKALRFGVVWLISFGFLSLMRLIADPDFWLDWTAYYLELQLGISLVLGWWLGTQPGRKKFLAWLVLAVMVAGWFWVIDKRVLGSWRSEAELKQGVEYRLGEFLAEKMKPGDKVFLSGSPVFWLNSWFDLVQVRGGVDQAAIGSDWREAAWEIREGAQAEKSLVWLDRLDVNWLVVHGLTSQERYHDFKYPDKFEGVGGWEKVYEDQGDRIYKRKD